MDANSLLKENQRLRKDIAAYQNALEAMELRARSAEQSARETRRRLAKLTRGITAAVQAAGGGEEDTEVPR
jgi:predicted  nucleic acid-binding Zn-ribbon protein